MKHTAAHYNLAMAYEKTDPREAITQWDRYIGIASTIATEKQWWTSPASISRSCATNTRSRPRRAVAGRPASRSVLRRVPSTRSSFGELG